MLKRGTKIYDCDILVIGGGLARVFAAIKAKEAGADKVTLVSKGKLGKDSIPTFAARHWVTILPEDNEEGWFKKVALLEGFGGGYMIKNGSKLA